MSTDKTQWIFDENISDEPTKNAEPMTESLGNGGFRDPTFVGNDEETELIARQDDEKTTFGRGEDSPFSEDVDPVTGWLVVVKGPGLGRSANLGAGINYLGRGTNARTSLPFGDRMISSEDHVRIIYDDAERTFLITPGSGRNVTRVNGKLLASTQPLDTDAMIQLSKETTVVFKPFCGAEFDWADVTENGADEG